MLGASALPKKKIIGQRISRCGCAFCFFVFLFLFICLYSGSVSAGALYYIFRCTKRQYNGVKYGSVCPGASVFVCMRKFCPWQEEEEEEEEEEEGGGRRGQREIDVFDDTIEDSGRLRAAAPR